MKNLTIFALAILFCTPILAQKNKADKGQSKESIENYYGFTIINNSVAWQQIFTTDMKINEIKSYFSDPLISTSLKIAWSDNTNNTSGSLYGIVKDVMLDYKALGYKWSTTPVMFNYPVSYSVIIDMKDSNYRVTITNILTGFPERGKSPSQVAASLSLDYYYNSKKAAWRPMFFSSKIACVFNDIFMSYFTVKDLQTSTDW